MLHNDFSFRLLLSDLALHALAPAQLAREDVEDILNGFLDLDGQAITKVERHERYTEVFVQSSLLVGGLLTIYRCEFGSGSVAVDAPAVQVFARAVQRRFANSGVIISTNGFTGSAMLESESTAHIQIIGPDALVDWARAIVMQDGHLADYFVRRIASIPVTKTLGEVTVGPEDPLPAPEILASQLNIAGAYEKQLVRVQHLPLAMLRAVANDPRALHSLTPRGFEEFTAELVDALGFQDVLLTPASRDGGRDIVARRVVDGIPITFFLECKKYANGNLIQLNAVRALLGVVAHRATEANVGVLVTTSRFTKGCKQLIASDCRLDGKDYDGVMSWVDRWKRGARAG